MKTRFNTFDIACGVTELQRLVGLRVYQVYDIDNKTYLIRLQGSGEEKTVLLIESGIRFHTTAFEWPKNVAPSGFSMKLRKHLKNKRLEKFEQLGADRIVDLQFGMGDAAYHVILELYDRGNIVLTDSELTILYILRPHTEGEEVRFAVREKYPITRAKPPNLEIPEVIAKQIIENAAPGDMLRRALVPVLDCGPAVIDHVLIQHNLLNRILKSADSETDTNTNNPKKEKHRKNKEKSNAQLFESDKDLGPLIEAIKNANDLLNKCRLAASKGFIIQSKEEKPTESGTIEHYYRNTEYHPYLFDQFKEHPFATYDTFMLAVDEFYSSLEGQKIDMKTLHQEREALKKLSNVKKDHAKRLEELTKTQEIDKKKAELITCNQVLVDNAILAVQSAIASQLPWPDIHELVKEAQANGDPVASSIKQLKLEINHISLSLKNPYECSESDNEEPMVIDVDLALSAWSNARRYYDQKRMAAQKEQKTIDASQKALKSAEKKTQQTLKDARTISTIAKARKVYWFEKFYWFISSENYLVIGGRDAQQNELIVKRYMRPNDIYVHAEIQGASSVIIRNSKGGEVPPKTLLEAGTMAISYSVAWDAKVVTNAYWVHSDQVTKTAPTGEYLGTGSFMIRGKKNFLPSCHLIMGLSLLFKLEDSFVEKHLGERKIRSLDEEQQEQTERDMAELHIDKEILDDVDEVSDKESDLDDTNKSDKLKSTQTKEENAAELAFPDTQVKVEHDTGRITIRADSVNDEDLETSNLDVLDKIEPSVNAEETTIITAAPTRKKQQQNAKKRKDEKERKAKAVIEKQQQNNLDSNRNSAMKRGQKGKLKKIKSKYKDQDDEERELRMMILSSSGKDKSATVDNELKSQQKTEKDTKQKIFEKQNMPSKQPVEADDADDMPAGADVEMLDALTGQPFEDDELIFAIPVVAPYQALQQYKYKVKLTPGTGKRGRAAKMALAIFTKDKTCNAREKDLLKSVKDEALARNIPGKVKLSAPQMQKVRK